MDFVRDHKHLISYLNIALFNLPYFAKAWDNLETSDFCDGDLSLYKEFNHPMGWNRSNIRSFLTREFKKHPDISTIINRDPPVFNSNHAAAFLTGLMITLPEGTRIPSRWPSGSNTWNSSAPQEW